MSRPLQVTVHEIAVDGLPDMDELTGRVAFLWDGCIVSGWPLETGLWEPNSDVGQTRPFGSVTHWVEFPFPVWEVERWVCGVPPMVEPEFKKAYRAGYEDRSKRDFDPGRHQ